MASLGRPVTFHYVLLPILCVSFNLGSPTDHRVLVLVDDFTIKFSPSTYFNSLTDKGFVLVIKLADDRNLALKSYGTYHYDALILFAPKIGILGGSLDTAAVMNFVDSGHSLNLAAEATTAEAIREIAAQCGADFDEFNKSAVIDHLKFCDHQAWK